MVCSIPSLALTQTKPDSLGPWNHRVVGTLTFAQVSYSNWAQGGQSALAYTATLDGRTQHNSEKSNWATTYKFAYGQTSVADQGFRKTDDKIDLQSVFTYKYGSFINPYVSATLKTQFAEGLNYDKEGNGTVVSAFFDPAFLTQAAGVGYQPAEVLKTRFGAALREIITSKFRGYSDDLATTRIELRHFVIGLAGSPRRLGVRACDLYFWTRRRFAIPRARKIRFAIQAVRSGLRSPLYPKTWLIFVKAR